MKSDTLMIFFASEEILFSAVSFYLLMYGAKVKLAYPLGSIIICNYIYIFSYIWMSQITEIYLV